MDFYLKLPRNAKEFVLFLAIISIISVNIIAPLITFFEIGFNHQVWIDVLKIIPFIWLCVVSLVLITFKPAEMLTKRLIAKDDSFNAHIIINILCTVFLMSIFLTIIGSWIGCKRISYDPIRVFFFKWPRNFAISFFIELLIAQPIARFVMVKMHHRIDQRN